MQSLAFSVCAVSVRGNVTQSLKVANCSPVQLDVWNWMRRYAGKEGEYQQESYAEFLKRKTKGMFIYTRIVKVVLKKSEYDWDGLYLYSSKKNQR